MLVHKWSFEIHLLVSVDVMTYLSVRRCKSAFVRKYEIINSQARQHKIADFHMANKGENLLHKQPISLEANNDRFWITLHEISLTIWSAILILLVVAFNSDLGGPFRFANGEDNYLPTSVETFLRDSSAARCCDYASDRPRLGLSLKINTSLAEFHAEYFIT